MRLELLFLAALPTMALAQQPTDTAHAQKRVISVPNAIPAGLPFSSAVQAGNVIYMSGQIGVFPGTRQLVDTGVAKQTQQALENVKATVVYAGSSMDRVFKCTVFLANIRDYDEMNRIYATFFPKDPPARSTVAGSGLALGARVEIECLALAGS